MVIELLVKDHSIEGYIYDEILYFNYVDISLMMISTEGLIRE